MQLSSQQVTDLPIEDEDWFQNSFSEQLLLMHAYALYQALV
jgi:hypothetical protein